jgi:hypothetical protein
MNPLIVVETSSHNMMGISLQNQSLLMMKKILKIFKIIVFSKIRSMIFLKWQMKKIVQFLSTVILVFTNKKIMKNRNKKYWTKFISTINNPVL